MIATTTMNNSLNSFKFPTSSKLDLTFNIPIPLSEPQYTDIGRQAQYAESSLQRYARVEYLRKQTQERRVAEWLKGQLQESSERESRAHVAQPKRHHKRSSTFHSPALSSSLRHSSPSYQSSGPELLYAIPEDSDEPQGYREPHIFYSSSPSPLFIESQPKKSLPTTTLSPPHYHLQVISPPSPSPQRAGRNHHRRRLSDLDVIPEAVEAET